MRLTHWIVVGTLTAAAALAGPQGFGTVTQLLDAVKAGNVAAVRSLLAPGTAGKINVNAPALGH